MTRTENWNPLDYQCGYQCFYCPEKKHSVKPKLYKDWDQIPRHHAIWVCSETDLFHPDVPDELIETILKRTRSSIRTCFIFCTKNPWRVLDFISELPKWLKIGVTVESDIDYGFTARSHPLTRLEGAKMIQRKLREQSYDKKLCLSIQPIMDFTDNFKDQIIDVNPEQVSIGKEIMGLGIFPHPDFRKVMKLARSISKTGIQVNIHDHHVYYGSRLTRWPEKDIDKNYDMDWLNTLGGTT